MNLTLGQLLPQCAGSVYVFQPRTQTTGVLVTHIPEGCRYDVFSDVELDTKIDYVKASDDCLEIHMEVER